MGPGDQGRPQAKNLQVLGELSQQKRLIRAWQQVYTGAIITPSSLASNPGGDDAAAAAAAAAMHNNVRQFIGLVGKYDPSKGYGFLECQETYALYSRNVFLHKDHWVDGLEVGDVVSFLVELNDKGWPQARNIQRHD